MNRLIEIQSKKDIPNEYQDSPIGLLLEYHNLGRSDGKYSNPKLLIGTCMDSRERFHLPDNFAYIIRDGGANLRYSEFKVSYAISAGGVRHIALIGHNHCGMVNLISKREQFIQGLVEGAGWNKQTAEEYFAHFAPVFEIGNEIDFTLNEAKRLRKEYPKIVIAPLIYRIEDNLLYMIKDE